MTYKYFLGCNNIEEVKKRFWDFSKKLHPDSNPGKGVEDFQKLNEEYQGIKKKGAKYPISNKSTGYPNQPNSGNSFNGPITWYDDNYVPTTKQTRVDERNVPNKNWIVLSLTTIKGKGFKEGSLYYNYLQYIKQTNKVIHENDIIYIADLLGYDNAWIFYRKKELGI